MLLILKVYQIFWKKNVCSTTMVASRWFLTIVGTPDTSLVSPRPIKWSTSFSIDSNLSELFPCWTFLLRFLSMSSNRSLMSDMSLGAPCKNGHMKSSQWLSHRVPLSYTCFVRQVFQLASHPFLCESYCIHFLLQLISQDGWGLFSSMLLLIMRKNFYYISKPLE